MMTRLCAASFAICSLLLVLQPESRADGLEQACQGDAQKLCGDMQPGDGHLFKCLRQNRSQLSPGCEAALRTAMQEVRACRQDAKQLCAGVPLGGGAMMQCLQQHQSSLSPDCASRLASAPGAPGNPNQPPPTGQTVQ